MFLQLFLAFLAGLLVGAPLGALGLWLSHWLYARTPRPLIVQVGPASELRDAPARPSGGAMSLGELYAQARDGLASAPRGPERGTGAGGFAEPHHSWRGTWAGDAYDAAGPHRHPEIGE